MDNFAKLVGGLFLGICGVFFFVILGTLTGALSGYVVGLFFSDTILGVLSQLGIHGVTMWQFGAFMGFCGGFLRTKVSAEVKPAKSA